MKRNLSRVLALALGGILLLAACSGDSSSDTRGTNPSSASSSDAGAIGGGADTVEGAGPTAGGSTSSVEGIPVPLAPGADGVSTSPNGPFTVVLYVVPLHQQAATIAFYDEWTAGQPDDYVRTEAERGGVIWQNDPDAGEDKLVIQVLAPLPGDEIVSVSIVVGPAE
ncbi:MAG TPA: hypothetical protein ENI86_18970 [Acidimicrobiales bacterium]|nr:hypothetical protein [Acidimicrobiales bacterium]